MHQDNTVIKMTKYKNKMLKATMENNIQGKPYKAVVVCTSTYHIIQLNSQIVCNYLYH